MQSTDELLNYGNNLFTNFKGVYALDQLPSKITDDVLMIVNTDSSNLPGTHWIAIISRNKIGYCFDPLGYPPPLALVTWLNRYFNRWSSNRRQIQSKLSTLCGYFCLHYLYYAVTYVDIPLANVVNVIYPIKFTKTFYNSMINAFVKNILN